jgi:hypothetical protein
MGENQGRWKLYPHEQALEWKRDAASDLFDALDALWRQAAQSPDLLNTRYGQEALDLTVAALAKARGNQ